MKSLIYNKLITPLTNLCYFEVLSRLPANSKLLDVGIGTGKALCNNAAIVFDKNLKIVGVDINASYLQTCKELINENSLNHFITVYQKPFESIDENNFDGIYFSSSFMLLPDQRQALEQARKLLSANGKIYFTQTLYDQKNYLIEYIKPRLKYLTSIEFGPITYQKDFFSLLEEANYKLVENKAIKKFPGCSEQLVIAAKK